MQSLPQSRAEGDARKPPVAVKCLLDPYQSYESILMQISSSLKETTRTRKNYLLFNASTAASEQEGISAAGADAVSRRLTPALDAEALLEGRTISAPFLPVSPKGIASPVVLTKACLDLLAIKPVIFDCGSFSRPKSEHQLLETMPAQCPSTGSALPESHVRKLFAYGQEIGFVHASQNDFLVLAECVPGGTTTAMAVLTAMGLDVSGLLSSSLPLSNHGQRFELVQRGLAKRSFSQEECQRDALLAVACLGDPMQAVVAGAALAASQKIPIILAGGSQMLAVWSIVKALAEANLAVDSLKNILVITTKWVAYDPSANVEKLASLLHAPFAASCPDFTKSIHYGLRAYEEGNVKEGVGAGACMALTHAAGISEQQMLDAIDACYEQLVTIKQV